MPNPREQRIAVIGSGAAGIISAHTLIQDGFKHVEILTRDSTAGGVWSKERVYPGLKINNVHGEYRFSAIPMKLPDQSEATGGRLTGEDMRGYMEGFAEKYLSGHIRFNTEILKMRRDEYEEPWAIDVRNTKTDATTTLRYSKIVLCTGGTTVPKIPEYLSPTAAKRAGFQGIVRHPVTFRADLEAILEKTRSKEGASKRKVVIVGGGKSAQDHASYLTNEGRDVTVVYEYADAFVAAGKRPVPPFLRRSRFLSTVSPYIELKSPLEWFFHKTWLGAFIAKRIWAGLCENAFKTFDIPVGSPLRLARSPFWAIRANDEGVARTNSFHSLAAAGEIKIIAPARVDGFTDDGSGVRLSNGQNLQADVVIVATGYASSWDNMFDDATANAIGINKLPYSQNWPKDEWNYHTLSDPPERHPEASKYFLPIYRGIVPAKNIDRRDFAINGAVITPNNGYAFEVISHWISSYFLSDKMRLPSPEKAMLHSERTARWLVLRYPYVNVWENPSISSGIAFWNWPQAIDELLEDMGLRTRRSGGNWFTWPFQVIDTQEIATLREERETLRRRSAV